ncbi:hypothetical protein [Burkholderia plantarii]|uniref:hypothetical protein n=1 Tax=Burkholderia plantarii TaxID=41899 RepID=UPI0018DEB3C8|nr:hypothetical protein [Burkholderia plantarii]MBI0329854.1 hypothetical protein [Burkholderia plantarii]
MRKVRTWAWIVILAVCQFCQPVSAQSMFKQSVVDSYGNCTWRENGDGTKTASLIINFKAATRENLGGGTSLHSRSLMALAYDKDGKSYSNSTADGYLHATEKMNGVGSDYGMLVTYTEWPGVIDFKINGRRPDDAWHNANAFSASVEITFRGEQWRAISVTAGNVGYFLKGFSQEQTGAAYLYPDSDGSGCEVVPPIHPPKPPVTIRMSAPDWDLGELPVDHGEKRFTAPADQLCFSYSGLSGGGVDVVVDADSQNGVVENQYQLKALADPTQVVPYSVALNDGNTEFVLPNRARSAIQLSSSGRTCFAPTFRTYVRPLLKKGDYSDTLTFTVVTKT